MRNKADRPNIWLGVDLVASEAAKRWSWPRARSSRAVLPYLPKDLHLPRFQASGGGLGLLV